MARIDKKPSPGKDSQGKPLPAETFLTIRFSKIYVALEKWLPKALDHSPTTTLEAIMRNPIFEAKKKTVRLYDGHGYECLILKIPNDIAENAATEDKDDIRENPIDLSVNERRQASEKVDDTENTPF